MNRELDALLGGEDGDSPIRFAEQERPRTKAGWNLLTSHARGWEYLDEHEINEQIRRHILRIEAEGRQQAVREIREGLDRLILGKGWENVQAAEVRAILDRVAGLNASESPLTCPRCGRTLDPDSGECAGEYIADGRHAASESGQPHNEGSCDLCTGYHDAEEAAFMNRKQRDRSGDASESVH